MATVTISMPDPMKDWIETHIKKGEYASTSDYVRDLVRRDRLRLETPDLTLEDLQRIVADARASGISQRSFTEIKADARKAAKISTPAHE